MTFAATAGFDELYGLRITAVGEAKVRGEVVVRAELLGPSGAVHEGVLTATAAALSRIGTERAVASAGDVARILSAEVSLARPVAEGTVHAVALARHRGRTTWAWEVELRDDADDLVALARVGVAVQRPSAQVPAQPRLA
ncbi:MAG: PaaI family thioesterase [Solirubrobacterales bacterium]|nr:PaaI family thioesterase [Solirubrobacterales bacterium]